MTCTRCGRTITNPASIKRGEGRVCHAKEIAARDDARQLRLEFQKEEEPMRGFIYRLGTAIKEFGERNRIAWLITLGYNIRGSV